MGGLRGGVKFCGCPSGSIEGALRRGFSCHGSFKKVFEMSLLPLCVSQCPRVGEIFSWSWGVTLVLAIGFWGEACAAADLIFVESGAPKAVVEMGQKWRRDAGYLELQGKANVLFADAVIDPGDFEIRARLQIDELENSAATFCFDDRSHLGFEGGTGVPFTEGPLFGDGPTYYEEIDGKVPEGKAFDFVVRRQKKRLVAMINGELFFDLPISDERLGRFGFRPWRSKMRIYDFRATGNLKPYSEAGIWGSDLPTKPVDVFRSRTEGYHTFRIPSLIVTQQGNVLAFAEGRKSGGGDAGDIDLLLKRSTDGGRTWSAPQVVWDDGGNTCGNPAPVVDQKTGRIWLFLTWNLGSDHERDIMAAKSQYPRRCYVTFSDDEGESWAPPKEMPHLRKDTWRWYATGPDKGIQLTQGPLQGRMVIPCNHSDHEDPDLHPYRSHVIYSDDHGESWKLGGVVGEKTNESTIVELTGGRVMDNMRSYHGKNRRAISISDDGGETWGDILLDDVLVEPVCQASILRLNWPGPDDQPGRVVFCNPASRARERLTLRTSHDDGKTWDHSRCLYEGAAAYSCLTKLGNGNLGVLFERDSYQTITFVEVNVAWLEGEK
jgi:sialidase-1